MRVQLAGRLQDTASTFPLTNTFLQNRSYQKEQILVFLRDFLSRKHIQKNKFQFFYLHFFWKLISHTTILTTERNLNRDGRDPEGTKTLYRSLVHKLRLAQPLLWALSIQWFGLCGWCSFQGPATFLRWDPSRVWSCESFLAKGDSAR